MKRTFILAACAAAAMAFSIPAFSQNALSVATGEAVTTGGWADMSALAYPKVKPAVIDDAAYPDPVAKRKAFTDAVESDRPKLIVLVGAIDLSDGKVSDADHGWFDQFDADGKRLHRDIVYKIGSNTALIGGKGASLKFGGMGISGETNVIIRNIVFYDAHGSTEISVKVKQDSKASCDALSVDGQSSGIWIDHCTFTDGACVDLSRNFNHDGAFDVKQAKNLTVSWCEFTNHDKVMLVGSSDGETAAEDRQITLHHNYYHGVTQRNPRSRGTRMHIYNNYYTDIGNSGNSGYCLGPGIGSLYIVENNAFGTHLGNLVKYFDSSASAQSATFSRFYHAGNSPEITACDWDGTEKTRNFAAHESATHPWTIPYAYAPDNASTIPAAVSANAGAVKPVTVNGIAY